ncbi:MAG: hypothetical protein KKC19_00330 [Nanoarchaeota archaeon]|nr:hypothetical protein [Nanoarchaeota archaeon]
MPTFTTSKLPLPKSWDEFEDISADIIKKIWKCDYIIRNGRSGQKQNGVDIYGKPPRFKGEYSGVQCKDKKTTFEEIEGETNKAEDFKPTLKEFIFTIGSFRDASLQEKIRILDHKRIKENKFSVQLLFWEDICLILSEYPELMEKHFPQFIERQSSLKLIIQKIIGSTAKDWIFDDTEGTYIFKKDTNLTIKRDDFENGRSFDEEWVKKFPDSKAYVSYHKIFYNSSLIKKVFLVAVDGYRIYIPLPHIKDLTINKIQYKISISE